MKRGRSLLARAGRLALVLAAAAGLALLASACGSSSGEGVAQVETTETTTTGSDSPSAGGSSSENPATYSACMRRNGVPNFPDPDRNGRFNFDGGTDSPQFRAAEQACRELHPKGGRAGPLELRRRLREALAYAACMRSHGVPTFPDPEVLGGNITILGPPKAVANTPQFRAAEQACRELLTGVGQ